MIHRQADDGRGCILFYGIGKYNYSMAKRKIRLILALVVLAASLALLIWGFWPLLREIQVLPIPPNKLQLPTPTGFLFACLVI